MTLSGSRPDLGDSRDRLGEEAAEVAAKEDRLVRTEACEELVTHKAAVSPNRDVALSIRDGGKGKGSRLSRAAGAAADSVAGEVVVPPFALRRTSSKFDARLKCAT